MTALLLEAEPDTSPVRLALLVLFEEAPRPFGLECWVSNCARPRIGDVYCALHAPQAATP